MPFSLWHLCCQVVLAGECLRMHGACPPTQLWNTLKNTLNIRAVDPKNNEYLQGVPCCSGFDDEVHAYELSKGARMFSMSFVHKCICSRGRLFWSIKLEKCSTHDPTSFSHPFPPFHQRLLLEPRSHVLKLQLRILGSLLLSSVASSSHIFSPSVSCRPRLPWVPIAWWVTSARFLAALAVWDLLGLALLIIFGFWPPFFNFIKTSLCRRHWEKSSCGDFDKNDASDLHWCSCCFSLYCDQQPIRLIKIGCGLESVAATVLCHQQPIEKKWLADRFFDLGSTYTVHQTPDFWSLSLFSIFAHSLCSMLDSGNLKLRAIFASNFQNKQT